MTFRSRAILFTLLAAPVCTQLSHNVRAQGPRYLPTSQNPANADLNSFSIVPWMQGDSRTQMFYGARETGTPTFLATGLSFRFDGPIPAVGAPGPFTIQRLRIEVGTTAVSTPSARFADNLTQPLTQIFDGPLTFLPDQGSNFPAEAWGNIDGALTFNFPSPVLINIPSGGRFVIDLRLEGNSLSGRTHAMLDAYDSTGGVTTGTTINSGQGCPAALGAPDASIATAGLYAPGAAHALTGSGLGANAPVFGVVGYSNTNGAFPLPFSLPGTSCSLQTSFDIYWLMFADPQGSIGENNAAAWLSAPADPVFNGVVLYEQLISLVPGANSAGIITTDHAQVTLGTFAPPAEDVYFVANSLSATFPFADEVAPRGIAVRIMTQ